MKYALLITFIVFSSCLFSQRYYTLGLAVVKSSKMRSFTGPALGFETASGSNSTVGCDADFYLSEGNAVKLLPVYFNLSLYLKKLGSAVSPFISLRPGYTIPIAANSGNGYKGGLAMAAYAGSLILPGKVDATAGIGYSYFEYTIKSQEIRLTQRMGGLSFFVNVAVFQRKRLADSDAASALPD